MQKHKLFHFLLKNINICHKILLNKESSDQNVKSKNKISKNITKNKEKAKKLYPVKTKILNFANTIFIIICLVIFAALISIISNKEYKFDNKEVEIVYDEIVAGQTFNRSNDTYYVVFYEFEQETNLTTTISQKANNNTIYKVNLANAMNKSIISNESNKQANTVEELKISGPTLIKIENGQNKEYIEGADNIITYLENL